MLQAMYAKDPSSLGDHGEKHWVDALKRLPGASSSDAQGILAGCRAKGGEGGGGGSNLHYELDDFWAAQLYHDDRKDTFFGYEPPRRQVVHVYVQRPPSFTGTWTTYYVNGAVFDSCEYGAGIPRRCLEQHDNGARRHETLYVDGAPEGAVVTLFANGSTEREETYVKGKLVGVQKWFYASGKPRQVDHWANDQREGRATFFDESGSPTTCIDYHADVEVRRGCEAPPPN